MKNNVWVFGAFMLLVLFAGCNMGNNNVTSQERAAEGFNGVSLIGAGNVNVHQGENFKLIVTTDSNLQGRVLTAVNGDTLQISQKSGHFNATELTIDVYMPELQSVSLHGAGNIKIFTESATKLDFSLSGAGNIDAQNFQVQNMTINHSGVGNAKIWATNSLSGTISGVGNILYRGNPTMNINKTGLGTIKPL